MSKIKKPADPAVGDNIVAMRSNWSFGGGTADHFMSHVRRSVPLYDQGHQLICELSDFFVQKNSVCYELGVSTGELIAKLAKFNSHKANVRWIGIDIEEPMIKKAREHTAGIPGVQLMADDVNQMELEKSDLIVSYYCIQFISPHLRTQLFEKIYNSLNWGGAFIMFEKVRAPDARFQDMSTALYDDYKKSQGYSDEEIMGKSRSLRGVLEPYTSSANEGYLKRAGFQDIMTVMKYICFEGFLAVK
jgi:tRNA (cmo5U34)-methyltransferase